MFVSKEEALTRIAICKGCDKYTVTKQCSLCNCIMPFKVRISGANCPEGKWSQNLENTNTNEYFISEEQS